MPIAEQLVTCMKLYTKQPSICIIIEILNQMNAKIKG